ncbi:MAG: acylphosphatase [Gammaproteobacteria bacterium]
MTKACIQFKVTGVVQGVWYRANTQKQAQALGLTGWVRNTEDRGVELIACGEVEQIKKLETWLWEGPPAAKVDQVVSEEILFEEFLLFEVRE